MSTFLAFEQSNAFWMINGASQGGRVVGSQCQVPLGPTRARPQPGVVPDARRIRKLGMPVGLPDETIHVNVADSLARGRAKGFVYHIWNAPDRDSYCRIDDEFFVSSPEFCFAQLANRMGGGAERSPEKMAKLVSYGLMICGTYAINPFDLSSSYNRLPLTTVSRLARYLGRMGTFRGVRAANAALKYVLDGSASPRESDSLIALCFPAHLGGYALPFPKLNVRVDVPSSMKRWFTQGFYRCDLLWSFGGKRLALEYQGVEHHTGSLRIAQDAIRRNKLCELGIEVREALYAHFESPLALEELAKQIALVLHYQIRSERSDIDERRYRLWAALRDPWRQKWV